jgi:hypothetical protein
MRGYWTRHLPCSLTCHEMGRDQGQNLVVGESPAGHRGQIVKMLTSVETLCPTKEGTQHQRVA